MHGLPVSKIRSLHRNEIGVNLRFDFSNNTKKPAKICSARGNTTKYYLGRQLEEKKIPGFLNKRSKSGVACLV